MRPLSLQPIRNMAKSRCEVIKVFSCLLRSQSNYRGQTEAQEEEDDTESELHVEYGFVTMQLEAQREVFIDSSVQYTRYNDECRCCQACHFLGASPNKDLDVMKATQFHIQPGSLLTRL